MLWVLYHSNQMFFTWTAVVIMESLIFLTRTQHLMYYTLLFMTHFILRIQTNLLLMLVRVMLVVAHKYDMYLFSYGSNDQQPMFMPKSKDFALPFNATQIPDWI